MEEIVARYGLAAVFLGAFLEGDITVIVAGVAAHVGILHLTLALAAGFLGGLLRDSTCYALGRSSTRARDTRAYTRAAAAVERMAGRFGPLQILVAPFVYGVRTASMVFWGVNGLPYGRFLALDALACAIWVILFSGAGYLLSDRAEPLIGEVKSVETWLLAAVVLAIAMVLSARWIRARAARRDRHLPLARTGTG